MFLLFLLFYWFFQGSRSHKHPVSSANHVRPTAPPPAPPTANQIRDMQPDTEIVQPIETDLQEEIKNKLHLRQNNKQQHTPKLQPHNKQAHIIYKHDLPPPPSPPPSLPKDTNPPPPPPPLFETPVAPPPFLPEQAPPTPPILSNQKTPSARDSRSDLLSAIREGCLEYSCFHCLCHCFYLVIVISFIASPLFIYIYCFLSSHLILLIFFSFITEFYCYQVFHNFFVLN